MVRLWIVALLALSVTARVQADIVTGADTGALSHVKAFDNASGTETASFFAYGPSFSGGVRVAAGDINGDNVADIITGAGAAGSGHVKVFDGSTDAEIRSFLAYGAGYSGGIFVGSGDVNHDLTADIITGVDSGVGPHVKVFDGSTSAELRSFFAYGGGYSGGVFVAAGDVNNDGLADLITGTDAGVGPHVKVFDGNTNAEIRSFFAYTPSFTGGVRVASADINGDDFDDIITGTGAGSGHVKVFDGSTGTEIRSFFAYTPSYALGVYVAGSNPIVPEPASATLLLLATLGLLVRRRV